jgi:hypothetical protein
LYYPNAASAQTSTVGISKKVICISVWWRVAATASAQSIFFQGAMKGGNNRRCDEVNSNDGSALSILIFCLHLFVAQK